MIQIGRILTAFMLASTTAIAQTPDYPGRVASPAEVDELMPPVESQGEIAAPDDPSFVMDCLSKMRARFAPADYEFGHPLFSKSPKWGRIVRIDFGIKGIRHDPDRFYRIVCFMKPGEAEVHMGAYDGTPVDPAKRGTRHIIVGPRQRP